MSIRSLALPLSMVVAAVAVQGQQRPTPLPALPLTQLDERALAADLDNRTFTFSFPQPVPIRELLLLLVRGTNLSIVPDPAISGSFIGELKNVTIRQALSLVLPPLGLEYRVDGRFIRVFPKARETRLFDINYVVTVRTATATIGTGAGAASRGTESRVSSTTATDFFADLGNGVQALLSEHATFNLDRKAGLLQVTDFPERLDRIALYLDAVTDRVARQVEIDARIIEVELSDENASALDWSALTEGGAAPLGRGAPRPPLTGLRVTDLRRFLTALADQGKVTTLASPRIVALNNEPAIVRGDDEGLGVTLSVTPQVTAEGVVMLSLSPIVTLPAANASKPSEAPAVREADTLARVADGETLVIAGFGRVRETRERKNVGIRGGWFGRGTVVTKKRVELLILLTPKIVAGSAS